jgi:hypothetical protein
LRIADCGLKERDGGRRSEGEWVDASRRQDDGTIDRLIDGSVRWVTVHPDGRRVAEEPPDREAILSGSFNPLHVGHERLAASAATRCNGVVFDLGVVNADKAPLGVDEVEARLRQFRGKHTVVLTRTPLFRDKAALFPGCTFVVGYDTAVRLVDPSYYRGPAGRDEALSAVRDRGCRFLVAAREADGVVRTLRDVAVPEPFAGLFVEIPASEFLDPSASRHIRTILGRP